MRKVLLLTSVALLCACMAWAQDQATQQPPDQPPTQHPATQQPSPQPSTQAPGREPSSQSPSPSATTSQSGSIQGCLSGSAGHYMLTQDNTGAVVRLTGSDDKLKDHVGHEVQITGQLTSAISSASAGHPSGQSAAGTAGSAERSVGSQTLQVSDVRMISEHCGTATTGSNPPTSSAGAAATSGAMSSSSNSAAASTPAESDSSMASSSSCPAQPSTESAPPQTGQESGVTRYSDMDSNAGNDTNAGNNANAANRAGNEQGSLPPTASGLPLLALFGVTLVATGVVGGNWRKRRMPGVNED